MNREDLISVVAKEAGITRAKAARIVMAIQVSITRALRRGDTVVIPGLGTWGTVKKCARMGRNPKVGKRFRISASKTVKFKAFNVSEVEADKDKNEDLTDNTGPRVKK